MWGEIPVKKEMSSEERGEEKEGERGKGPGGGGGPRMIGWMC